LHSSIFTTHCNMAVALPVEQMWNWENTLASKGKKNCSDDGPRTVIVTPNSG
jgi:hypothetical protein